MARKIFLRFVCIPGDIVGYLLISLLWLFFGEGIKKYSGFWVQLKPTSWFVRNLYTKWRGTALCHGGILFVSKEQEMVVLKHELVHVEQFEVLQFFCFFLWLFNLFISLITQSNYPWIYSLVFWALSWPFVNLSSSIVALLRNEPVYRGSSLEEAAYAIVEEYTRKKDGYVKRGNK